jgi:hypothetical protein
LCEHWPIISGNDHWVEECNDIRSLIAHGGAAVNITKVAEVSRRIDTIRSVAHRFLIDSQTGLLSLDRCPPLEDVSEFDEEIPFV